MRHNTALYAPQQAPPRVAYIQRGAEHCCQRAHKGHRITAVKVRASAQPAPLMGGRLAARGTNRSGTDPQGGRTTAPPAAAAARTVATWPQIVALSLAAGAARSAGARAVTNAIARDAPSTHRVRHPPPPPRSRERAHNLSGSGWGRWTVAGRPSPPPLGGGMLRTGGGGLSSCGKPRGDPLPPPPHNPPHRWWFLAASGKSSGCAASAGVLLYLAPTTSLTRTPALGGGSKGGDCAGRGGGGGHRRVSEGHR